MFVCMFIHENEMTLLKKIYLQVHLEFSHIEIYTQLLMIFY